MTDELDEMFFDEIHKKVDEMQEIAKSYGCGVLAIVVPITPSGHSKMRLLRPAAKRGELLGVMSTAYDWAVQQIEKDPRLKD